MTALERYSIAWDRLLELESVVATHGTVAERAAVVLELESAREALCRRDPDAEMAVAHQEAR
ncbi:MAG: hypothetical protein FD160_3768 [Caulobacteraceae bacterium]|nr:MAG: hypothetical protein FD160_3768 [Caulobacteraceae bacterium]